jgi:nicotinamide-nucleotide amidase
MSSDCLKLIRLASEKKVQISVAESCTGGLLMARLTEIPGSSSVLDRGFLTYSNKSKIEMLNVKETTLLKFGAVSLETAQEMAFGAYQNSSSSLSISITGVAGPGFSDNKPEGLVCFGWAGKNLVNNSEHVHFGQLGRKKVRGKAVEFGLCKLNFLLQNYY